MDLDIRRLDEAFNRAMIGSDMPETVMWSASGLRKISERMVDAPNKEKWLKVADECPAGCTIMMSQGGKITYFNPDTDESIIL